MNYRHIFHAGNFADVMKHAILCMILEHLRQKDTPFCVLDTHAGIGRYDLSSEEAQKTGEAVHGVARVLAAPALPEALTPYRTTVESFYRSENPCYPGSPVLARHFLRPQDRLTLVELHPDDCRTLRRCFRDDPQVTVHQVDGYQALKAFLPPPERRGLVLIDPPFEAVDEFASLADGLRRGYKKWPTGIFALWYPIKERPAIWRFEEALLATGIHKILKVELLIHDEDTHQRMNGSGMIIVNPPYRLDETLQEAMPPLQQILSQTGGTATVSWLVKE